MILYMTAVAAEYAEFSYGVISFSASSAFLYSWNLVRHPCTLQSTASGRATQNELSSLAKSVGGTLLCCFHYGAENPDTPRELAIRLAGLVAVEYSLEDVAHRAGTTLTFDSLLMN